MPPIRPGKVAVSVLLLVCTVAPGDAPLAGGAFLVQRYGDRDVVDLTDEVIRASSERTERILPDGVVLEVRYPPGSEVLAEAGLAMMERLHDLMTGVQGLRLRTGARLYLVELDDTPPSFRIVDASPRVAGFAILDRDRSEPARLSILEGAVYDFLAHEWGHEAISDRYGRRSPGERARWIDEGFASWVQYTAVRELWPEGLDRHRARRLPSLNLGRIDLGALLRWKFAHGVPPREPMDEFLAKYGAALGVFVRIEERGGARAVLSFLDRVAGRGRLREAEVDSALRETVGADLATLARISPVETRSLHEEAIGAIQSDRFDRQSFGLAVIERLPDRIAGHRDALEALVTRGEAPESIRARAAQAVADQGPRGAAASLLRKLRGTEDRAVPEAVEFPLVLRLATDDPACGVESLGRLSRSPDRTVADRALEVIRELADRKLRPDAAARWAESKPFGFCDERQ